MLTQLSAQDASFAFMESPATPMHIGSVYIYDPSTRADGVLGEERLLRAYEERLHLWPAARRRLVRVPFDADYPYWIEDPAFDLEYHVRSIALPAPGDWNTLCKITARIFARPLDMTRPLWEVYVIQGLDAIDGVPPGSFAVLTKVHHAAVDGASGMHMVELLHDLGPEPVSPPLPDRPWHPDPVPTDLELMARSGFSNLTQPFRFARVMAESAGPLAKGLRDLTRTRPSLPTVAPKTRFGGRISQRRVVNGVRVPLDLLRAIRRPVKAATVNDAVLSICGGAFRHYLHAKNELPPESLIAMAPINVRTKDEHGSFGNRVSAMFVPIGTHIADPLERLDAVHTATASGKAMNNAVSARMLTDYSQFVPAATAALAGRLASSMADGTRLPYNVSITNVPGPQKPIWFQGARMVSGIGLGPISHGMGMIMPITSYCGEMVIGFTSCRDMLPDAPFFVDCVQRALQDLQHASGLGSL